MSGCVRSIAVLSLLVLAPLALAQPAQDSIPASTQPTAASTSHAPALNGQREQTSYMLGMTVGRSIADFGPDVDFVAFERAIKNAFAGKPPLLEQARVRPLSIALMQRAAARTGQPTGGTPPQQIDKAGVGLLVGADVGRQLAQVQDEIDLPVFLQAVRTIAAGGMPLLSQEQVETVRAEFGQRLQTKALALSRENRAKSAEFLAGNKNAKGVQTTASGLQYRVLRQGAGPRPQSSDRVRVNYQGSLLDGKVFDSSYERGEPVDFALDKVIAGWTEGLALMPIGSKYRFWIPSELAYGEKGTPGGPIPPNSALVFDVELLDIL